MDIRHKLNYRSPNQFVDKTLYEAKHVELILFNVYIVDKVHSQLIFYVPQPPRVIQLDECCYAGKRVKHRRNEPDNAQ